MKLKKSSVCFLVLILMISLLAGCASETGKDEVNNNYEEFGSIVGFVVNIDESGRSLVVSETPLDFSDTGGDEEFYEAIYFSEMPEKVEVGDKVKVWHDIVMESYPAQSSAEHAEILEPNRPEGANKSEKQVVINALAVMSEEGGLNVNGVKSVEFDKENSNWVVELVNIFTREVSKVEIED